MHANNGEPGYQIWHIGIIRRPLPRLARHFLHERRKKRASRTRREPKESPDEIHASMCAPLRRTAALPIRVYANRPLMRDDRKYPQIGE
jgi:hypothetical protein